MTLLPRLQSYHEGQSQYSHRGQVMTETDIRPGCLQVNLGKLRGLGTQDVPDTALDRRIWKKYCIMVRISPKRPPNVS